MEFLFLVTYCYNAKPQITGFNTTANIESDEFRAAIASAISRASNIHQLEEQLSVTAIRIYMKLDDEYKYLADFDSKVIYGVEE